MTKVMLIVRKQGSSKWQGLGTHEFAELPRIGDGIELEFDGEAQLFRVVAFHHPERPTVTAGDVFAVYVGPTAQAIGQL